MENRIKIWGGIDPGFDGAMAWITESGESCVIDFPGDASTAAAEIIRLKSIYDPELFVLERVWAMPKQGISSAFKFGHNFGCWEGVLAALKIPFLKDPPRVWQKGLVRKTDGQDTKSRSLAVARGLFPTVELSLKKHHNRAEALLMAYYAKRISQMKGGCHDK